MNKKPVIRKTNVKTDYSVKDDMVTVLTDVFKNFTADSPLQEVLYDILNFNVVQIWKKNNFISFLFELEHF